MTVIERFGRFGWRGSGSRDDRAWRSSGGCLGGGFESIGTVVVVVVVVGEGGEGEAGDGERREAAAAVEVEGGGESDEEGV